MNDRENHINYSVLNKVFKLEAYTVDELELAYRDELSGSTKNHEEKKKGICDIVKTLIKNTKPVDFTFDINKLIKEIEQKIFELEKGNETEMEKSPILHFPAFLQKRVNKSVILQKLKAYKPDTTFSTDYIYRYYKTNWKYHIFDMNRTVDRLLQSLHDAIKFIKRNLNVEDIDCNTFSNIQFYSQILCYHLVKKSNFPESLDNSKLEEIQRDSIYFIAYLLADKCIKKQKHSFDSRFLALLGLFAPFEDIEKSWLADAMNIFAINILDDPNYLQLAYDIYYSWLHGKILGEVQGELRSLMNEFNISQEEFDRCFSRLCNELKNNPESGSDQYKSLMYANYAYTCGTIADTYEVSDNSHEKFMCLAMEYVNKALELSPANGAYYCTRGTLFLSRGTKDDIKKAICDYQKYLEKCDRDSKNEARFSLVSAMGEWLLADYLEYPKKENLGEWYARGNSNFKVEEIMKKFIKNLNTLYYSEKDKRMFYEPLHKLYACLDNSIMIDEGQNILFIKILTLLVAECCNRLYCLLKRDEYQQTEYIMNPIPWEERNKNGVKKIRSGVKPVAYYTTQQNFSYIFSEINCKKDSDITINDHQHTSDIEKKNCFTVMHAKYMNDPQEGTIFVESVLEKVTAQKRNVLLSSQTPQNFREDIYRDSYVFLKSFTEVIDQLHMWNRYASDRSAGKDSSGCCVIVNTSCFGDAISVQDSKSIMKKQDDFHLYRVVYLSKSCGQTKIDEAKNQGISKDVISTFDALKILFGDLNKCTLKLLDKLSDDMRETLEKEIYACMKASLKKVIFLFKDESYSDEVESRILLIRDVDQSDANSPINMVSTNPKKLCLNPPFQVFVDEVIFGPNARSIIDDWTPYFQYELTKMWEKKQDGSSLAPSKRFKIRCSNITYRS